MISEILVNHMIEPIGFELSFLRIDFKLDQIENKEITKKIEISEFLTKKVIYQTEEVYTNNFFEVDCDLSPRTRYKVKLTVLLENKENYTAETFFETGKMNEPYTAKWIGHEDKEIQNTLLRKDFQATKKIISARLYITGLGVYEAYINHHKVGDEFLTPGVTDYKKWTQVQTYDITDYFKDNHSNQLMISLGDGWYKGNMGFDGGTSCIYGDRQRAIAEYHLVYEDQTSEIIVTDGTWEATSGKITKASIYYGEDLDDTKVNEDWQSVLVLNDKVYPLQDRLSLPIKIQEYLEVKEILYTPSGETVLDFGQNNVGWIEFFNTAPKGIKISFEMGEILQENNFYRDNLRNARAAFTYISDGEQKWVRPHFTYFGYRYVKIEGFSAEINPTNFRAAVMYSDMTKTGEIKTDNKKVNRLFENVMWGQKGNFFDIPTDCPQRDERLGWTGDATIFSNTAALNMDVFAFFKKYMRDVAIDQLDHQGMTLMYSPAMGCTEGGAAVWGDAATIIPWNMYQQYDDTAILKQNYDTMKQWVDWITLHTKKNDLWTGTFQFGDWLALDGENPGLPTGKTDEDYIASVYYYYSTSILAQTANLLGDTENAEKYAQQTTKIKQAIQSEYITKNGRLAIDTQTAYALALHFKLIPKEQEKRVAKDLVTRLKKDQDHLKTGFVGTPFVCQVLSEYGYHDLATKIFLHEDYPSWLYAVNLGATTIWERWNSVEADGSMNPEGMNSLNHYSFGAIMEWAYKYVVGLQLDQPGYKEINFVPQFDFRLKNIQSYVDTPYGKVRISYQLETNQQHEIQIKLTIPFGIKANVCLPRSENCLVHVDETTYTNGQFQLTAGEYSIRYCPSEEYIGKYTKETPVVDIMDDPFLVEAIDNVDSVLDFFKQDADALQGGLGTMSLAKLNTLLPFINIDPVKLEEIHHILENTPLPSERVNEIEI